MSENKTPTENKPKDEKSSGQEKVPTRGTIMVLEDSEPARNVVAFFLEKNNYTVKAFGNGHLALESLKREDIPDLKLILTDIMMPEIDGFEFIKKLKELNKFQGVPILIMSAMSEKESVLEAKKLGVYGYVVKPISVKKLMDVMKKIFPNEVFKDMAAKY